MDKVDNLKKFGKSAKVTADPEAREVAGFEDLIGEIRTLISQGAERTQADLVRNQAQLEVLATLQKMVRANGTKSHSAAEPLDLGPLKEVLAQIAETQNTPAVGYTFDIKRHEGGAMAQVVATPHEPTHH